MLVSGPLLLLATPRRMKEVLLAARCMSPRLGGAFLPTAEWVDMDKTSPLLLRAGGALRGTWALAAKRASKPPVLERLGLLRYSLALARIGGSSSSPNSFMLNGGMLYL